MDEQTRHLVLALAGLLAVVVLVAIHILPVAALGVYFVGLGLTNPLKGTR